MNARDRNRAEFPKLAQLMDQARARYGADVKLVAGIEDGREIGKVDDEFRKAASEVSE